MRSFHQFLKNTFSAGTNLSYAKREVIRSPIFSGIMKDLGKHLCGGGTISPNVPMGRPLFPITGNEVASATDTTDFGSGFFYSHPKLSKLEEIVLAHFRGIQASDGTSASTSTSGRGSGISTRVMIFSQYRESVQEITDMLSHHSPLIKAMSFVGHSAGKSSSKGLTQKEQTQVLGIIV
jgi:Fanconi anemia group M protein